MGTFLQESLNNYLLGHVGGMQTLLQDSLDKYLLGCVRAVSAGPLRPYVVSKAMEQLVYKNIQVIQEFEEQLLHFRNRDWNGSSVIETLLGHFDDALRQVSL